MGFGDSFILGAYLDKGGTHKGGTRSETDEGKYNDDGQAIFNTFIKEQYYMLGNAVCPPVIAVIAGAILNCVPAIQIDTALGNDDWLDIGLWKGIELALEAVKFTKVCGLNYDSIKGRILSDGGSRPSAM